MQLVQEDLLKSWFPNKLTNLQLTYELKDFFNYNKENNINYDKSIIIHEQDAIQKIFPLSDNEEINEDTLITHRLYEITNNTDFKVKCTNSVNNICKANKKIFNFKKVSRNMGRKKHSQTQLYYVEANHNKFREDNIVRKIKIYFTNSLMMHINKKYSEFIGKKTKKLLIKIKPNFTKVWTKKENQEYLKKTVKEVFSERLSSKCTKYGINHNINQIRILIEENEAKEVINILNKTIKDMYLIYIGNNNKIPGFNLDIDLLSIEKRNGEEYTKVYKSIAMNLIEILCKKGRKE